MNLATIRKVDKYDKYRVDKLNLLHSLNELYNQCEGSFILFILYSVVPREVYESIFLQIGGFADKL